MASAVKGVNLLKNVGMSHCYWMFDEMAISFCLSHIMEGVRLIEVVQY